MKNACIHCTCNSTPALSLLLCTCVVVVMKQGGRKGSCVEVEVNEGVSGVKTGLRER